MADNTPEEQQEIPAGMSAAALPNEPVNAETDNMEVHHHTHHDHGKRNWRSYFWEFLMLFLAVFCGFLAEYQLEHTIEHQREKKYMESLSMDLAADTVFVNTELDQIRINSNGLDSLINNLYSDSVFHHVRDIYRQQATYNALLTPELSDQTITQLRNSGNMRLIQNEALARSIGAYWKRISKIMQIANRAEERVNRSLEMSIHLFNRHYVTYSIGAGEQASIVTVDPRATFLTNERKDLIAYANWLRRVKSLMDDEYQQNLRELKQQAINLIQNIQQEYRL